MPKAIEAKKIVKYEIDKDILGTKSFKWVNTVALPEKIGGDFHKDLKEHH
jgi:hypothetical protein